MNYELRIPAAGLTEEGFATLKAQMRMFFGMPADVMPRSEFDLRMMLEARLGSVNYPFRKWLTRNGYEVVRPPTFERGPNPCYVIRGAAAEKIMHESMSRSIMQGIDAAVVRAIKGE